MPEPAGLTAGERALVRISAALATRRRADVEEALRGAGDASPVAVEEVLLQSHLFVGFPDALEALRLWREVAATEAPAATDEECGVWAGRGEAVCRRVYGANYGKLRRNVAALHPELDRWMVEGGYGRVLGRGGLALATRELCVAALLAAWGAPRQLHSHLRGALNAGAAPAAVHEAVEIACGYLAAPEAAEVRALRDRVTSS